MSNIIPFKTREQLKKEKRDKIWEEWLEWEEFEEKMEKLHENKDSNDASYFDGPEKIDEYFLIEELDFIKKEEKIAQKEIMRNKPVIKTLSLSPDEWRFANKLLDPK